ncbi:C4-dicarboxylate ABC transporter permease [Helicobacter monodelphidis]|uniref:TRAP transporter small permease n=1 Tax=Helicobacter sp. 15-1451 TaxID=2004995 RepID=UPI000DCD9C28|nr:TRAP transporter small permease [Helicobacter sp. 15-1451]RAX56681.1 C4-dicarboxylate ABC transporter permease [Helicobacter sp. 15-1451]
MLSLIKKPFYFAHKSPTVNKVFQILDVIIASVNKNVAVVGLALGVIITAVNVFMRTISSWYPEMGSITWGEEMARYCFIWSALFGAAYGFRKGVHISVMVVVERFPPPLAKACVLFSYVLCSIYLAFMCYAGFDVVYLNYELGVSNEAIHDVPLWYFLVCLPIAFLGATYRVIEKIYEVSWMDANQVVKNTQDEIIHDTAIKD